MATHPIVEYTSPSSWALVRAARAADSLGEGPDATCLAHRSRTSSRRTRRRPSRNSSPSSTYVVVSALTHALRADCGPHHSCSCVRHRTRSSQRCASRMRRSPPTPRRAGRRSSPSLQSSRRRRRNSVSGTSSSAKRTTPSLASRSQTSRCIRLLLSLASRENDRQLTRAADSMPSWLSSWDAAANSRRRRSTVLRRTRATWVREHVRRYGEGVVDLRCAQRSSRGTPRLSSRRNGSFPY